MFQIIPIILLTPPSFFPIPPPPLLSPTHHTTDSDFFFKFTIFSDGKLNLNLDLFRVDVKKNPEWMANGFSSVSLYFRKITSDRYISFHTITYEPNITASPPFLTH